MFSETPGHIHSRESERERGGVQCRGGRKEIKKEGKRKGREGVHAVRSQTKTKKSAQVVEI